MKPETWGLEGSIASLSLSAILVLPAKVLLMRTRGEV